MDRSDPTISVSGRVRGRISQSFDPVVDDHVAEAASRIACVRYGRVVVPIRSASTSDKIAVTSRLVRHSSNPGLPTEPLYFGSAARSVQPD
jgi:hypothetical protein